MSIKLSIFKPLKGYTRDNYETSFVEPGLWMTVLMLMFRLKELTIYRTFNMKNISRNILYFSYYNSLNF